MGCQDLPAPKYGWVRRDGRELTAGCGEDKTVLWNLLCKGDVWNGKLGNCSYGKRKSDCCLMPSVLNKNDQT